jgi:RimJ/RimL family protein N-acetyltransferase
LLESGDLPSTLLWRNQDENRCWFVHSDPLSWEEHIRWFQEYRYRDDDFLFIAEDLQMPAHPIGQAGLYRVDWDSGSGELGRLLIGVPAARRRGLGFEITRTLLDLGFGVWGLRRVHLVVFTHNTPAIKVYNRCGFKPTLASADLLTMELTWEGWKETSSQIDTF